jgi:uncharacterized damage-inducible protein DinB
MPDPAITVASQLFRVNDQLFNKALDGVSPEHLLQPPGENSNPMIWIAGHVTYSRTAVARIAGAEVQDQAWTPLFRRGASLCEATAYPPCGEIREQWNDVSAKLFDSLASLRDEDLSRPAVFNVPTDDQTVRGAITFLNFHETYHIGQLAYLRKWLGYSQLVG